MTSDLGCHICGSSPYRFSGNTLCPKCEDLLDKELYKAARSYKVAKLPEFWEYHFKDKWTTKEVENAFWHLVQQNKAFIALGSKWGFK